MSVQSSEVKSLATGVGAKSVKNLLASKKEAPASKGNKFVNKISSAMGLRRQATTVMDKKGASDQKNVKKGDKAGKNLELKIDEEEDSKYADFDPEEAASQRKTAAAGGNTKRNSQLAKDANVEREKILGYQRS